jgi:hypothetical protein
MTNLGILHYFLGLQVLPLSDGFFISQSKYVVDLLTHFKMADCKPRITLFQSEVKLSKTCQTPKVDATLYRQMVGSLFYLSHSQFDISFVVDVVSCFMQDPRESHWKAVKRIICYFKGTTRLGIQYCLSSDSLVSFTDSDSTSDNDD